jgi:hypothetical protein
MGGGTRSTAEALGRSAPPSDSCARFAAGTIDRRLAHADDLHCGGRAVILEVGIVNKPRLLDEARHTNGMLAAGADDLADDCRCPTLAGFDNAVFARRSIGADTEIAGLGDKLNLF